MIQMKATKRQKNQKRSAPKATPQKGKMVHWNEAEPSSNPSTHNTQTPFPSMYSRHIYCLHSMASQGCHPFNVQQTQILPTQYGFTGVPPPLLSTCTYAVSPNSVCSCSSHATNTEFIPKLTQTKINTHSTKQLNIPQTSPFSNPSYTKVPPQRKIHSGHNAIKPSTST